MEKNGAGDTLKWVGLGYFPLLGGVMPRGVVALRDWKKGDVIIRIPYEMAVNLGPEGEDPTLPAVALLNDYCAALLYMARPTLLEVPTFDFCRPLMEKTGLEAPISFQMKLWMPYRHRLSWTRLFLAGSAPNDVLNKT